MSPEDRRRLLKATNLCLSPDCVAHDTILGAIIELEIRAYDRGYEDGSYSILETTDY